MDFFKDIIIVYKSYRLHETVHTEKTKLQNEAPAAPGKLPGISIFFYFSVCFLANKHVLKT